MAPHAVPYSFRRFFVILVGALFATGVAAAPPPAVDCALPAALSTPVPANVRVAGSALLSELTELAARSRVVRDMLEEIGASPRALVAVRADAEALRSASHHGLSTAGLSDGVLVVQVRVGDGDRASRHRQIVLAHELAHVVEFVSLPRLPARELANLLTSREGHHTPWSSSMRIETPFARAVEQAVSDELRAGQPSADGVFHDLATRHRVGATGASRLVACAAPLRAAR